MSKEHTPTLVRLIQCGRRSCGFVLTEDERHWKKDPEWEGHATAVCPMCEEDSFYTLKENGQKMKYSEREQYREGIDPEKIEATPRMGQKMRMQLQAAKRRALAAIAKATGGAA